MRRLEASCQVEESHHYHRSRKMKEKGGGDDEMNVVVFWVGRLRRKAHTHKAARRVSIWTSSVMQVWW